MSNQDQEKYDSSRNQALAGLQNTECQEFLRFHNIDPDKLFEAVNLQRPFDGVRSSISGEKAGLYRKEDNLTPYQQTLRNLPVSNEFEVGPGTGVIMASYKGGQRLIQTNTVAERSDVYFRPSKITAGTIIHEAIHSLTGYTDSSIQFEFGIAITSATINITEELEKHGCTKIKKKK